MPRSSTVIWLILFSLLILPSAAGRFLLDLAGGLIIFFLAIPLLLTGLGWLGWKIIQSRIITCEACGASSFQNNAQCPICGSSSFSKQVNSERATDTSSTPASSATIDITAEDAENEP